MSVGGGVSVASYVCWAVDGEIEESEQATSKSVAPNEYNHLRPLSFFPASAGRRAMIGRDSDARAGRNRSADESSELGTTRSTLC